MSETCRLQWDRQWQDGTVSRRVRYQRGGGPWREVGSIDELPPDVRRAYEQVRGLAADKPSDDRVSVVEEVRRRRMRRRRPTRSREVDRTLALDHPWFDGFFLLILPVAVMGIAWYAWPGLSDGGWSAVGSWLMLGVAATLAYFGLCVLVNVTEYRIEDGWLSVRHGPLPWPGNVRIPTDRILQISTRVHHSRHHLSYSLWATVAGRSSVRLAEGIRSPDEARSVERAIERHLGIEDWS